MARVSLLMLGALSLLWGASFLFIKVAVDGGMDPLLIAFLRCAVGAITVTALIPLIPARQIAAAPRPLRVHHVLLIAVLNMVLPFTLIAWGETRVDSGVASILNAGVPLFSVPLAVAFDRVSHVGGRRAAGVPLGFLGIVALIGPSALGHGGDVLGELAIVGAAVSYAIGGIMVRRAFVGRPGTTGALMLNGGSVALLAVPVLVFALPSSAPTAGAWASVVALGALGTAVAHVIYFELIQREGATQASMVTYLVPPTALVSGTLSLDETVRARDLAGLALILAGVAVVSWPGGRKGQGTVTTVGVTTPDVPSVRVTPVAPSATPSAAPPAA